MDCETESGRQIAPQSGRFLADSPVAQMFVVGLIFCTVIYVIDSVVLALASQHDWKSWHVFLAFGVFVVQTAILGAFVGSKSRTSTLWMVFFFWMLLLINLQLCLIGSNNSGWRESYRVALVFAFYAAQIGLVVLWGILGSWNWQKRIPMALGLFLISCYPYFMAAFFSRRWFSVLNGFVMAIVITCLLLRWIGISIGAIESDLGGQATIEEERSSQFTIRHLLVWTTMVALMFGVGRWVPWELVSRTFVRSSILILLARAMLMALIAVATIWIVGGRQLMWLKGLIYVLFLAGIAGGLFYIDVRSNWNRLTRGVGFEVAGATWFAWTMLNGFFLAGLFLVFRESGHQVIVRKRWKNREPVKMGQQ